MNESVNYRGQEITKVVIGHSYPRNGNLGNPTPRVRWMVGGVPSTTLRSAKELVDLMIETGEA